MARVKGGMVFTYLLKEGVLHLELFTHYRGGVAPPENQPTPLSGPLVKEKMGNGPLPTIWPISFYGGGLGFGPQDNKCRQRPPL